MAPQIKQTATIPPRSRQESTPAKVVLIADDASTLNALEAALSCDSFELIKTPSGSQAIEVMSNQDIAAIICDESLADMSGASALKAASKICPDAARILLCPAELRSQAVASLAEGDIAQLIVNPWDDTVLQQAVRSFTEQYRLTRQYQKLLSVQHQELAITHENLRHELKIGARIYEVLLMGKVPTDIPGLQLDAATIPSKEIDGDFYDFYHPSEAIFDLVIGDVMGKGIPAALVGTAVKTQLIRFALPFSTSQVCHLGHWQDDCLSPATILTKVHGEIAPQLLELGYFVSLLYGRYDLQRHIFTYVDCGAPKPLHYRAAEGKAYELKGSNFPLGMVEHDDYQHHETSYTPEDTFVFYSDGVTETRSPSGELFGIERLTQILQEHGDAGTSELLNVIIQSVLTFAEKDFLDDDLTLVVVKVLDDGSLSSSKVRSAKFASDLTQLPAVRQFVDQLCRQAPGNNALLSTQLQLAINEVFCNISKHQGQGKSSCEVVIKGELTGDGLLLEISDQGTTFNPLDVPEPSLAGDLSSGFGLYIIKEIADQLTYIPKQSESGWNHFRLFKHYLPLEDPMELNHNTHEDVLVVTLHGEHLDAAGSPFFKERVLDLIETNNHASVVFDLSRLQFIDSSGLGSLLSILRHLNTKGGDLKIANMTKPIRAMFEVVRMHKLFEIFNSIEDAVSSFK